MKKILSIISLSAFAFLVFGCSEILDETPETLYNEAQVFSTEQGVESALNGLYQSFADPAYHGSSWHGLIVPISGKFYSNQGASEDATSLNCSPSNTWLTRLWPQMFTTINVANTIIDNLENTTLDLNNRETALGQAYFIRAATYFDLVRFFGDVPLKTEPTTTENLHTPRAPKSQVYDLIISDFEKAKAMLPNAGEYLVDRPIKFAANAYLAKVYMQLAGEDGGNPALWQNAFDEAIQVYGRYSLEPNFFDLYDSQNENTSESIFEIQYGQNGAVRNADIIRFYSPQDWAQLPITIETFGRVRPNKETFDQHLTQYPDDPRIDATFIYGSYQRYNNTGNIVNQNIYPTTANGNNGFPFLNKYVDLNFNGTTTSRNFIKIRYADVLLMLAEIENELNGPGNAYAYVNEVLARARNSSEGTPATQPADWSGMSQDEFRSRIMRERQYELLGEGHEWFDTRRRGYQYFLDEVIETHNNFPNLGNRDFIYPISVKNMLLPIPSTEISGNQGITQADQNPGY